MEPHPIPQNVTSFQFRLIGDMTLKQFVYLATGIGIAYLLFVLLAASYPLFTWPLIVISALSGVIFAFLPLGSRPLDHWLGAFLKAVYSPTKKTWQKNGKKFNEDPLFRSRFIMYTSSLQPTVSEKISTTQIISTEAAPVGRPIETPIPSGPPAGSPRGEAGEAGPPIVPELPTPQELQKTVDLARQAQTLQAKIIQTERALNQIRVQSSQPSPIPVDYSQQAGKILEDLQRLVGQASQTRQQLDAVTHPQPPQTLLPPKPAEKVKVVIPIKPKPQQLALTSFPNVINGIVKDNLGNYLEGVVAVTYDKEGLPVRALKTNKLGQFSGATPLPNGTYTLELEKEGFNFDVLQIELDGSVLPPVLITAK